MRERHGQLVELLIVRLPEQVGGRHLEHDRLRRDLHRRHRDLVLLREVFQRLQVRIAGDEVERVRRHRRHALDAHVALGLGPQRDERGRADRAEIHGARQEPVIDDARAGDLLPVGLHVDAERLGVLLDQVIALHQHEGQECDAELLRDGDLGDLGARRGRAGKQQGCRDGRYPHEQFLVFGFF
jgi:hypothetical protein